MAEAANNNTNQEPVTDPVNTDPGTSNDLNFSEVTPEKFDSFVESDDKFKKWFNSRTDKRVTDGINTALKNKTEQLSIEIENRIKEELLPAETAEQRRIKELERKDRDRDVKEKMLGLENYAIRLANEKQLNLGGKVSSFIRSDDTEVSIQTRFDWMSDQLQLSYDKGRNSFLKNSSHEPMAGDDEAKTRFKTMAELQRYLQKNPGSYPDCKKDYERLARQLNR